MQRLSGLDAGFLYMETPTLHMHTLKVVVLEPAPDIDELPIEWVRDQIASRLHLLPPFRKRIVEVPFGLNHPVWIEDPDFDIEYHVRPVTIPAPGGQREMDETIAEIASRPLDRRRPLWELYLMEGLADGRVAALVKIHHAAADGVAASQLLINAMTTFDDERDAVPPLTVWQPDRVPTARELVREALIDRLRVLRDLPELLLRTLSNLVSVMRRRRHSAVTTPFPVLSTPRTSFNSALTPHRSFATTTLPLAAVKEVKTAFGVTVNDVVLALAAGALRSYLLARDELPDRSLLAGVPVSTDRPDDIRRLGGNKVSNLFTSLFTNEVDPVRRLEEIHAVTAEAKVVQNLLGAEMMQDWVEYTSPKPYERIVRLYSRMRIANQMPPPINCVVSNVPGPREQLFAGGARLDHIYSVGPILEGIGLNITVWSYLDDLNVGVLGCREAVPDPWAITEAMHGALDELLVCARRAGEAPSESPSGALPVPP